MNETARTLHQSATVIDCLEICNWSRDVFEAMRRGGLTAANCTCSILEGFRATAKNIVWWQRAFEEHADLIMPVHNTADIQAAKAQGKTGIILGFQNTSAIEDDLDLLTTFHQLGVRVIQLTYMEANLVGQGCLERIDAGLTSFGLEVIEEMNRLGILIDLSHVGHRTTMEAIEASSRPVAFTHANPISLCNHPRNKPDEAIKAVAARGGVVGATIFPPFLPRGNDSTLSDYIDVVDYMVDMIGIDHLAVGTDFTMGQPVEWFNWILTGKSHKGPALSLNHPLRNPAGIDSPADFPNLTEALLDRGYSEIDTRKILGENMLGLLERVWTSADEGGLSERAYRDLKSHLDLTHEQRLMLDSVPMLLIPRWFFVAIMRQVEELCGREKALEVYYRAGWEGAVKWTTVQMKEAGLSGRAVMEQYMTSAGLRGWGRLEVVEYDEEAVRVKVRLANSAVAEEIGVVGDVVCHHLPSSVAGAFDTILKAQGRPKKVIGIETKCAAKGDDCCEFVVTEDK